MTFLQSSYDESKNENQDKEEDGNQSVAKQTRLYLVNPQMNDSAKPTLVARAIIAATQLTSTRERIPTLVLELLKDGKRTLSIVQWKYPEERTSFRNSSARKKRLMVFEIAKNAQREASWKHETRVCRERPLTRSSRFKN